MKINDALKERLVTWSLPLDALPPNEAFPAPGSLSASLAAVLPDDVPVDVAVSAELVSHFVTAAVDIWLRAVHSFLVSAALTKTSPIWSSVSGYYSSHYAVRGFAHLLGYFQLFQRKRIASLSVAPEAALNCNFTDKKGARDAEHKLYWRLAKNSDLLKGDGLFTENRTDSDESDVRHRSFANYADHLMAYPAFAPLNEQDLKDRIDQISKIVFDAPPIPRFSKFPDVEYVQLIAYHRLIAFRRLLDESLGDTNRFWNENRNPFFVAEYMNFQLADGFDLTLFGAA